MPRNHQQTNEVTLNKRTRQFELNEIAGILEEERIRNRDDSEEDEMAATMPNSRQKRPRTKRWPAFRRLQRWLRQSATYGQLQVVRFFRRKAFNMRIRYEAIKRQQHGDQRNAPGHLELATVAPLPANVPYCQIGKSSLIAALKQFNWSHTQGPFVYNQ